MATVVKLTIEKEKKLTHFPWTITNSTKLAICKYLAHFCGVQDIKTCQQAKWVHMQ